MSINYFHSDEPDPEVDEAEDEFNDTIIRAKWTIDGARTLTEAAQKLRDFANWLEEIEAKGHQLRAPIDDDYGFVVPALPDEAGG